MKINSILSTITALAVVVLLASCGGSRKEETADEQAGHASPSAETAAAPSAPLFEVDKTFQSQLAHILEGYLKVKDAFVASDAAMVKQETKSLKAILKAVDTKMLSGPALNDWSNYSNNLDMALAEMMSSDDIEVQRTSFSTLSENLYKSIKAYGLGGVTTYYEFCPMAFDDQGAYWLSANKEIRNPYFGDKMLTCGRVTEELN